MSTFQIPEADEHTQPTNETPANFDTLVDTLGRTNLLSSSASMPSFFSKPGPYIQENFPVSASAEELYSTTTSDKDKNTDNRVVPVNSHLSPVFADVFEPFFSDIFSTPTMPIAEDFSWIGLSASPSSNFGPLASQAAPIQLSAIEGFEDGLSFDPTVDIADASTRLKLSERRNSVDTDPPELELQHYLYLFFSAFIAQIPIVHVNMFASEHKPPVLLGAMQACGALFVKTRKASIFITKTLVSAQKALVQEFAKNPTDSSDQIHLILAVVLLQTIGLFHQHPDQRASSSIYHGMLVMMIRRTGIIQKNAAWEPKTITDAPLEVLWQDWVVNETTKRYMYALHNWLQSWLSSPDLPKVNDINEEPPFICNALPFYWLGQVSLLAFQEALPPFEQDSPNNLKVEVRFRLVKQWLRHIRGFLKKGDQAPTLFWDELMRIRLQTWQHEFEGGEEDDQDGLLGFLLLIFFAVISFLFNLRFLLRPSHAEYTNASALLSTIHRDTAIRRLNHLIIVPGHAIWKGVDPELRLREDQAELAREDAHALLVFSGGQTRSTSTTTEGESYMRLALAADVFQTGSLPFQRATTEDHALDSYQNLLFSIARFHEYTGRYPTKITIVGYEFKRARFTDLHRAALRWPIEQFQYIGVDPINGHQSTAEEGEVGKRILFRIYTDASTEAKRLPPIL
ncbi:hypothetical protein H0H81_010029 [Sphagnurus paluster]|uniref:Xylanolytic transcriptional activator regulatory domain-containing protein n=1 Tax=Sphagnurus paluster TaxID=117069 RepID=A0A9P7G0W8_9AGAR|nr:hypothetical protein H0H81_010029 [Sphagnurus paluster]